MSKEILTIPEENLAEVIMVIRVGLKKLGNSVSNDTRENLEKWCDEEEEYLKKGE